MPQLIIPASREKLDEVMAFIDRYLEEYRCPMKQQMAIELSIEELFVNIASYAYPDGRGNAEIRIHEADGVVEIILKDSGIPYDPLKKPDPDVTLSAEDRQIGGLGIYLVKKNMDEVSYAYQDQKNILTLKKRIRPAGASDHS